MALTVTTGSVAGVPLGQEKTNTLVGQDTLFHGETLLVVSSSDLGDVALKTDDDIDGFSILEIHIARCVYYVGRHREKFYSITPQK